jgi:phage terminase large subunit-like protein
MRNLLKVFLVLVIACSLGGMMYSQAHADRAVMFFEGLKHTKGKFHGEQFKLLPWEEKIIREVYGTLREDGTRQYKFVYIEIPKKNGKSELAAGAALYHLFADGEMNGEIYGCAADRSQASLVYNVAKDMISQNQVLSKRARITDSRKEIKDKRTGSVYKVESAEAYTKHGLNVSCCIFDELHAQPNRDLWDVMTSGSGDAREQPIWWIITTAGDDPDRVSIGWEEHEYAMKILAGEIIDPTWYVTVFNYDGDDIYNEANWYKANPSLDHTITIDGFREAAIKAKNKPADERLFRWLRLNQWITTKLTTWLPLEVFDQTAGGWTRNDLAGKDCYVGMDLSSTTDLTALCALFPPQGEQLEWRAIWDTFIPAENMVERVRTDHVPYDQWEKDGWITATPGNVVDYTEVKKRLVLWNDLYNVKEVPSDRAFAAMLLQELEKERITCVDVPQTYAVMTGPINLIETLLKKGEMTHESNPVARWAFGNASIAKNGNEQIKFVKEHKGKSVVRTKRIDPIVALANAMARAQYYNGKVDLSAVILGEDWGM